ncbi:hypothetical protein GCM10020000_17680 [Streptomyces olivoverticillatus]
MPAPSYVAPRGYACPGQTCMCRVFHSGTRFPQIFPKRTAPTGLFGSPNRVTTTRPAMNQLTPAATTPDNRHVERASWPEAEATRVHRLPPAQ